LKSSLEHLKTAVAARLMAFYISSNEGFKETLSVSN